MSNEYETLMRCVRSVRTKTDFVPDRKSVV